MDPVVGYVLCDDVIQLYRDEILRDVSTLSRGTMNRVGDGLRAAMSL